VRSSPHKPGPGMSTRPGSNAASRKRATVRVMCAMRLFGRIEDKHGVDDPGYEPPLPPAEKPEPEASLDGNETRYAINPVGVGVAVLGGALLALASFLPLDESNSPFARVQSNTLIQHGGWWFILAGALVALAAVATKRRPIGVIGLSVVAGALVVYFGSDKSLRTLYPIGTNGEPQESASGTVVPLGIAIYVAGAGALLAFIGGWVMLRTRQVAAPTPALPPSEQEATQRCPDCAETILAQAHVCKHCGYRFENEAPP